MTRYALRVQLPYSCDGRMAGGNFEPLEDGIGHLAAGAAASVRACELDRRYGDTFGWWSVDLIDADTGGSFFQLFHGRTR